MALDLQNMYISNAHRLSLYSVSATVTNVYAGQLFQLNASGEWEYADGTKRAYPTLNNRFPGAGLGPQGERLEGRDDVSRSGKIAVLMRNYEIGTDQYDTSKSYVPGNPLVPSTDSAQKGKLTPYDSSNVAHKVEHIIGYVTQAPASATDYLRYEG